MNKVNWGAAIFFLLFFGIPGLFFLNGRFASPSPAATVSSTFETVVYPEAATVLSWNRILFDTGLFDPNYPTRLTAPKECLYLITAQITWSNPYGAPTYLSVLKNSTTRIGVDKSPDNPFLVIIHPLIQHEYVELYVYIQGEAGMHILSLSDQSPLFSMSCIGDMGSMDYPNPQSVGG